MSRQLSVTIAGQQNGLAVEVAVETGGRIKSFPFPISMARAPEPQTRLTVNAGTCSLDAADDTLVANPERI